MLVSRPIRVLIVDDHALFRRGLHLVLSEERDIAIVGEAEDGIDAVVLASECAPDVVLMDVRMPRRGGIEATRLITQSTPEVKVVMLTVSEEESDLLEAIRAGASGYLLKEVSIEEIAAAVRSVARGLTLISPSMATRLVRAYRELADGQFQRYEHDFGSPVLTPREISVLQLVANGMGNRAIAEQLCIAENTVKNHIRNILEKLHVHSRTEAVLYAVRERLIEPNGAPRRG